MGYRSAYQKKDIGGRSALLRGGQKKDRLLLCFALAFVLYRRCGILLAENRTDEIRSVRWVQGKCLELAAWSNFYGMNVLVQL